MMKTLCVVIAIVVCVATLAHARPKVGPASNPLPVSSSSIRAMNNLVTLMTERWQRLDADCSPLSPFAITYLYMTQYALNYIQEGYFEDGDWMTDFIQQFAARYSAAIDTWLDGGSSISKPWLDAFQYSNSNRSTVVQDLFLGMNVHINYDLAIIVYQMKQDLSRKPDYDRVNDLLMDVMPHVSTELGDRYDPSFKPGGSNSNSIEQGVVAEMLLSWRDGAWVNGQLLITTGGGPVVYATLQTTVAANSLTYKVPTSAQAYSARQAYCADNHHSFSFV